MKILLSLFTTLILVGTVAAQDLPQKDLDARRGFYRTYQMPDGAVLKGRIIGRLPKDSVVIETRDGLVYHLSNAEAKKAGKLFSPPTAYQEVAGSEEIIAKPKKPAVPFKKQPLFFKGASQIGVDLMTHFSSGGSLENSDPESGIVFSASYLYGVSPQLKVGGGLGIMTVKSGSKERIVPVFVRGEYQLLPKISASLSAGYSLIPTNEFVLNSKNGLYSSANVSFDLVGPESAYTSRIGIGLVAQKIDLGRTEVIREGGFNTQRTYTQYVERNGLLRRLQITFTHAWRMPSAMSKKRSRK
ncbi:MAG: hypothetical protein AB8F78_16570 [Saprospiraceae bacterium]